MGIAAALEGAREVSLTDGSSEIVEIATLNVKKNLPNLEETSSDNLDMYSAVDKQSGLKVHVGKLRWGNQQDEEKWISGATISSPGLTVQLAFAMQKGRMT